MSFSSFSGREFNQDVGAVKRAAAFGPVFITDRGRPAHVLMTIEEYRKLIGQSEMSDSLLDLLAASDDDDFDFDPPRVSESVLRGIDLE